MPATAAEAANALSGAAEFGPESIVVVGAGKMGEALISGWTGSFEPPADAVSPKSIVAANPGAERRAYISQTYGVAVVADASEVRTAPQLVVLAVKPQAMGAALEQVSGNPAFSGGESGPLFVSIAAGVTTEALEAALPAGARVLRAMPNTPLMVGAGATGVCRGSRATDADVELGRRLFGCLGAAVVVDEADMDAVCAVSGSGPAYVDALIEAMRDGGVREGLDAELAETLAIQTVFGAAKLLIETGTAPAEAREAVCSPGGTTLAGLSAMESAGFSSAVTAGVAAAAARSKELGSC